MSAARPSLELGDVIAGRFRVEGPLGTGGMGRVFDCTDLEIGDRVAVKVLRAGLEGDDQAVARFRREAAALAALRNPNVAAIRAFGEAGGRLYIAMERVDGPSLDRFLAEHGPVSPEAAAPFLEAICAGLDAMHRAGLIHRDLKPSNVLLAGGELARAKLVDLGIARARWLPSLTESGLILGTPRYMAPEQLAGVDDLDARADVYAAGVLLFLLLSGEEPFPPDIAADEAMLAILTGSCGRLGKVRPDVPPAIEAVVHRALARPREGRFASAPALCDAYLSALAESAQASGPRETVVLRKLIEVAPSDPTAVDGVRLTSPPSSGLSTDESRLACVVLGRGPRDDLAALAEVAHAHGAELAELERGLVLCAMAGDGPPTDRAAAAARCALDLKRIAPALRVCLVTGRSAGPARRPAGSLIERAIALLEQAGDTGVATEAVTAGLLHGRFTIDETGAPLVLHAEQDSIGSRRSPCIGRDRELAALESLFRECVDEPLARPVLVTGEAGMGKSRLVRELLLRLRTHPRRPAVWHAAAEPMGGSSPFALLGRALRGAAAIGATQSRATKLRAFVASSVPAEDVARVTEFVSEIVGLRLAAPPSVELTAARRDVRLLADQMQHALDTLLSGACAAQPLLIVLEDLHWADPSSLAFLDRGLRAIGARPCLLLATARPEVLDRFPDLFAGREVEQIRLGRLRRKSAEEIVRAVIGTLPAARLDAIVERAAGNPFCLHELARAEREGRGDVVPDTVLGMVEARLAQLGSQARRVLRAASIFGGTFTAAGLRALVPDAHIEAALQALGTWELVEEQPAGAIGGAPAFCFTSGLVREAAYAMLTEDDRRLGHELAAGYLHTAGASDPLVLAEHLRATGLGALDALRTGTGPWWSALAELVEASDAPAAARIRDARALRDRDVAAYLAALEGAAEELDRIGQDRLGLALRALSGHALVEVGAHQRAEERLRALLPLAARAEIGALQAEIGAWLAVALAAQGRAEDALAAHAAALERATALGRRVQVGQIRSRVAELLRARGDLAGARAEALVGLELVEAEAPPLVPFASAVLSAIARDRGETAAALAAAERAFAGVDGAETGRAFVRLVYAEALEAAGDHDRASGVLWEARRHLLAEADAISDEALRTAFLEHVPENRRILALARVGASALTGPSSDGPHG